MTPTPSTSSEHSKSDFSKDARKRDLLEAKVHIEVQRWIDEGGLKGGKAIGTEGTAELSLARFGGRAAIRITVLLTPVNRLRRGPEAGVRRRTRKVR
jgi:hypothetical protein